ncbi:PREDICTED: carbohydrate sulfotransferase 4-like [Priapulus caudatus]|uniref:Carbohydrate sulfotransferase 4-like n=1 Tax=Priapulus caudatus TaxID=37621 RepID=A0ABM1EL20_PRICU|nr:PREDICTED: carbohydrate sulfotransferase 4-like [Priapulus caudatus]
MCIMSFEPLHAFKRKVPDYANLSSEQKAIRQRSLLTSLFLCKPNKDYQPPRNFMYMSKAITETIDCPMAVNIAGKIEPNCSKLIKETVKTRFEVVPAVCNTYGHCAIKVIRANISDLEPLLEHPILDVKILHLIRDPRGMFRSWWPSLSNNVSAAVEILRANVKIHCADQLKNLVQGNSLRLRAPSSYRRVRYEDLAAAPVESAKQLYDFVGLPELPPSVYEWLDVNTQGKVSGNQTSKVYRFGTFRKDSNATATAWMDALPPRVIKIIEEHCYEFMLMAGYKPCYTRQ